MFSSLLSMTRAYVYIAMIGVVLATSACHTKEEARTLVTAMTAFRKASNEDKPALADALDKVQCTDAEVCAVKAACTKSADATAKGLRLQQEVQAGVVAEKIPNPDETQQKWKDATANLDEGFARLEECTSKLEHLKSKYGL